MEKTPSVETNFDYSDEAFKKFMIALGWHENDAERMMDNTRNDESKRHLWYKHYGDKAQPPEMSDETSN